MTVEITNMTVEITIITLLSVMSGFAALYASEALLAARSRRARYSRIDAGVKPRPDDKILAAGAWVAAVIPAGAASMAFEALSRKAQPRLSAVGEADTDPRAYAGMMILLGVFGLSAGLAAWGFSLAGLIFGCVLAFIAAKTPDYRLEAKIKTRKEELAAVLPDFIDLTAIGVEAGLSIDRAIEMYCAGFTNPLATCLSAAMTEIALGRPRRIVLKELSEETGLDELSRLITSILQSDRLGAPQAEALKLQARVSRERQGELIRELSATAPVKMLFPIAGLILPALFIVIIGPAFLQFIG